MSKDEKDRTEVEIKVNGVRTFYVLYWGDATGDDYDPTTDRVSHGSAKILENAAFFAWLKENGK